MRPRTENPSGYVNNTPTGSRVFSDTMGEHDNAQDHQQAIGWGIDLIQTDAPEEILRAIKTVQSSNRE